MNSTSDEGWRRAHGCVDSDCVEVWRKSSHSDASLCVEVAWRKSSFTGITDCVEVAQGDRVLIRDSKDPDGPKLQVSRDAWQAFLDGAKAGQFDV